MAIKLTPEKNEELNEQNKKKTGAQDAANYLKLQEGQTTVFLVGEISGGVIEFDQTWIKAKKQDGTDYKFPVQNFAAEIGAENDPATQFAKLFPDNVDNNGKGQKQWRMLVAVEESGEFKLKILQLNRKLKDLMLNLVAFKNGESIIDNGDCEGRKLIITKTDTGKKFAGYAVYDFTVIPKETKTARPDFKTIFNESDFTDFDLEEGLGGKTPDEVVKIINERGFAFEFNSENTKETVA